MYRPDICPEIEMKTIKTYMQFFYVVPSNEKTFIASIPSELYDLQRWKFQYYYIDQAYHFCNLLE